MLQRLGKPEFKMQTILFVIVCISSANGVIIIGVPNVDLANWRRASQQREDRALLY